MVLWVPSISKAITGGELPCRDFMSALYSPYIPPVGPTCNIRACKICRKGVPGQIEFRATLETWGVVLIFPGGGGDLQKIRICWCILRGSPTFWKRSKSFTASCSGLDLECRDWA